MEDAAMLEIESTADIHDAIERLSKPPCLDLFGCEPFSGDWTVAGA
jgi:hypothetical protein